jgi:hypothetical protein
MSLMVSWLAGQVSRPVALLAGEGEAGSLAEAAAALAEVAAALAGEGGGAGAPAAAVWTQPVLLAAMMTSKPVRA